VINAARILENAERLSGDVPLTDEVERQLV
jgi:hypothetical protein